MMIIIITVKTLIGNTINNNSYNRNNTNNNKIMIMITIMIMSTGVGQFDTLVQKMYQWCWEL